MQKTNISHLKSHLSEILRGVKRGRAVWITERGAPIAKIVPLSPAERQTDSEEEIASLVRRGIARAPLGKKIPLEELPLPIEAKGSALQALLEERESSRW